MNCYKVIYTAVTIHNSERLGKDGVCNVLAETPADASGIAEQKYAVPITETHGSKEGVEVTVTGVHEIAKDVIV
jgi:hypothetical protein